jgi:hypothetical protein
VPRYDRPDEPYYFGEVIGSYYSYHRPTCHIVRLIAKRNYKRLRDHREAQALSLKPCPHCRPPFDPSLVRPLPPPEEDAPESTEAVSISARDLGHRRRVLLRFLDQIDDGVDRPPKESIAARIGRLAHRGLIPRQVAACMRVITEMRNAVEYQAKTLSRAEAAAVKAVWAVIRDWAIDAGLNLPPDFEERLLDDPRR